MKDYKTNERGTYVMLPENFPARPVYLTPPDKSIMTALRHSTTVDEVGEALMGVSYMMLRGVCYELDLIPLGTRDEMFRRVLEAKGLPHSYVAAVWIDGHKA